MTTANKFAEMLVSIAVGHGVESVVCSPGSRNAPLLVAVAAEESLASRVIIDERAAAFVALGEAIVSRKPVMLLCTSGTALLNYAPAVAEAYYAGIPLIVVSADRPAEWIDQDDSQTLRQFEALDNFVKKSYDLPVYQKNLGERKEALEWFVERSVNDAMLTATTGKPGPVHINIQLDTPLGSLSGQQYPVPRIIEFLQPKGDLDRNQVLGLAEECRGKSVLLLAGFTLPDNDLRRSVAEFSRLPNVCVMAETVSNLHPGDTESSGMGWNPWSSVDAVLSSLSEEEKQSLRPDIVITLGGALISRQAKEYLRKYRPGAHWALGKSRTTIDPLQSLTVRMEVDPARFLRQLARTMKKLPTRLLKKPGYRQEWETSRKRAFNLHARRIAGYGWSDLVAFDIIGRHFPSKANLFLSNGTAVRYDQLLPIRSHATYCNRGVSGIDGSTSTAVGGALAYGASLPQWPMEKGETVLITGDTSFLYDLGILAADIFPENLKIIILNNGGGGIFRFIGSTSALPSRTLENFFCAPQSPDIKGIAAAFHLEYFRASSEQELRQVLPSLFRFRGAAILEIQTDGEVSADILRDYLKPF